MTQNNYHIALHDDRIDHHALHDTLRQHDGNIGGICSFQGLVRPQGQMGAITALELEHYPAMTHKKIEEIVQFACQKFSLGFAMVVHRVGKVLVGDDIVFVGATSPHRDASFLGCRYMIDWLKTDAPFWKIEHGIDGASHYVTANAQDQQQRDLWAEKTHGQCHDKIAAI